jgi:hypothetical protein
VSRAGGPEALLGLGAWDWLLVASGVATLMLLGDALAGHLRSGFRSAVQYAPFVSGGALLAACGWALARPGGATRAVILAGAAAIVSGVAGAAVHVVAWTRRAGGLAWWRHFIYYGPPPLAPLGLAAVGALAAIAARGLQAPDEAAALRSAALAVAAVALLGGAAQSLVMHDRGAFHNPLMYAPAAAPVGAALAAGWVAMWPRAALVPARVALWATVLTGFIGLGMHLRGFDRQMGGLYVAWFNWLEGPPAFAPGLLAAFAAAALAVLELV